MLLSTLLLSLSPAPAQDWAEARATLPLLSEYVSPGSPRDLLAWAAEGETITAYTRDGDACRPVQLHRTPDDFEAQVVTCNLDEDGTARRRTLELGQQATTAACTQADQPVEGGGVVLALVLADPLSAQYAPAVGLRVECPRIERLQHCSDGTQRVCSSSPGCYLLEVDAAGLVTMREASVAPSVPADCSHPCAPGITDPEGTAAWINALLGEQVFVPLNPSRGIAVYRSEDLCLADASWGGNLLRAPDCSHDRLDAQATRALDRCLRPRKKDAGLSVELQALVGPTGRVMAVDLYGDSPRTTLWRSCLLDELEGFDAGSATQGHAWTYTATRTLELAAD
jgi:hypothetical protein